MESKILPKKLPNSKILTDIILRRTSIWNFVFESIYDACDMLKDVE